MAPSELTGVLLVGGAGRRFGSPKARAMLDGRTLAERAWRTLGDVAAECLAVGKSADALPLPFPLVDDGTDVRAPIAGVAAALRAARHELVVVLPIDMPLVAAEHLRSLADGCARDAAIPQTGPLPCALRRRTLSVLERRIRTGQLALRDAFAELDARVVEIDPAVLENVNTPAELAGLQLRVVPLSPEHVPGFRELVATTLAEFGFTADRELDPDLDDPAAVYEAVWVALRGDRVVGSVALRRLGAEEVELKRMYLRPSERGHGIGRRLLDMALLWAREHGIRTIKLDTTERMEAARRLYEAYGFVRIPGDAPRQGQSRLLYELRLDQAAATGRPSRP